MLSAQTNFGAGTPAQPPLPDLLKQYNYGAQIGALNDLGTLEPSSNSNPVSPEFANGGKPAAGPDERVLYSFGAGLPTVVCAPLRVCIIELQAGEHIVGEPQIGDSVRWNISPAMYGAGSEVTCVIVLKPTISGLHTNLLIATDRRAYYLRLIPSQKNTSLASPSNLRRTITLASGSGKLSINRLRRSRPSMRESHQRYSLWTDSTSAIGSMARMSICVQYASTMTAQRRTFKCHRTFSIVSPGVARFRR